MVVSQFQIDHDITKLILGTFDSNLKCIEKETNTNIHVRGADWLINGTKPRVQLAENTVNSLINMVKMKIPITVETVRRVVKMADKTQSDQVVNVLGHNIFSYQGKSFNPKSINQQKYVNAIETNTITFGIGPAGTGKTYLAIALAVRALITGKIKKIVLTRPAVEAGERLGFLPGTLSEKIDPYLRPLFDTLNDMLSVTTVAKSLENGAIEVCPLAFMRGRTLNDAFVILDEAQNTTKSQMKMFLTRLGINSKMVITGDISQIDLPTGFSSGLVDAKNRLIDINSIGFCELTNSDIVRHDLIANIVSAYETDKKSEQQ